MPVLEGSGLALIGVDREQARAGLVAHQRPFAAGGKARAAKAAQSGIVHRLDDLFARAAAIEAGFQQRIAALAPVLLKSLGRMPGMRMRLVLDGRRDTLRIRLEILHMTDGTDRRVVAGAHAGRAQDAHAGPEFLRQLGQQLFGASHRARQRVANPHGDGGRRQFALLHHIEMRVKGRDLIDLGQRQFHLGGQRSKMRGGKTAVFVLNKMQVLDQ